jgi:hypothetical protein
MQKRPYLIVGNGKLARHFKHYFKLLDIEYYQWARGSVDSFNKFYNHVDKIVVLIADDSIESFIKQYYKKNDSDKIWIHCSGILSTPLAISAHPLSTFGNELYDLETYKSVPFVTEKEQLSFKEIFPEFPNSSYQIPKEKKNFIMHGAQ